jgi:hypothetical protein
MDFGVVTGGIGVFIALRNALAGSPWMPPVPASILNPPQAITLRDEKQTLRINGLEC